MKRRAFLTGAACAGALALGGCATRGGGRFASARPGDAARVRVANASTAAETSPDAEFLRLYAAQPMERFHVPAVDISRIPQQFWRRRVPFQSSYAAGTILVDRDDFFLYLVEGGGTAMRYGVGLGRAGFGWSGRGVIALKRKWPKWTPPDSMIARQPELERWSIRNGGMPPGPNNPLGARALYIFQNGRDTLYRVHGTPNPGSIGNAVSSGCVRMLQQDIIDLYQRAPIGRRIVVT